MPAVIQVTGLSKRYQIGKKRSGSLRETLSFSSNKLFSKNATEEFWALKDVTFDVQQGEVLGIIGKNGAGKSTLLKILSRITEPTTGSVVIDGRVSSLLEVGTGFHPELTGRENIFLNGAILGMRRAEIKRKFDEIVAFSGIDQFIDTPVKHYSSGMYVRLAFAVAAHLEPEILIIDEVLAVGDAEFQKKCLGKMKDVSEQQGRTVIFVSHNMEAVQNLCHKAILLKNGRKATEGTTQDVIISYLSSPRNFLKQVDVSLFPRERGKQEVIFKEISFNEDHYLPSSELRIDFKLQINTQPSFNTVDFGVHLVDVNDQQVYHLSNLFLGKENLPLLEQATYRIQIPKLRLKPGQYKIWLWLATKEVEQDWLTDGITLEVQQGNVYRFSKSGMISGITQPDFDFQILN
jgi:lipopolysaccharide transport system ATP-binding protein